MEILREQIETEVKDMKGRKIGYRLTINRDVLIVGGYGVRFHGEEAITYGQIGESVTVFFVRVQKIKDGAMFGASQGTDDFRTEAQAIEFGRAKLARMVAKIK